MNKANRKVRLMVYVLVTTLTALLLLVPLPCLVVSSLNYEPVLVFPMLTDKTFTLGYVHSVHKTPVDENFVFDTAANPANLVLTSTSFDTLGVGIPYARSEGKLTNHDGRFYLTGINREFKEINLKAMPLAQHSITVKGRWYAFNDFFAPGSSVHLKAARYSTLELLWHRLLFFRS